MNVTQKYTFLMVIVALQTTATIFPSDMLPKFKDILTKERQFVQQLSAKQFPMPINSVEGYFNVMASGKPESEREALQQSIVECSESVRVICDKATLTKAATFLAEKKKSGNPIEQQVYGAMTLPQFIFRLYDKRPLVCFDSTDRTFFVGESFASHAHKNHLAIGTAQESAPFVLANCISYPEREMSELFGIAAKTPFINNGNRGNKAAISIEDDYEKTGIFVGLVGPRYELPGQMACKTLIDANNKEGGDIELTNRNLKNSQLAGTYLRPSIHKARINSVIEPFLLFANEQGKEEGKKVYLHVIGLGLGNWSLLNSEETNKEIEMYFEVFKELLETKKFEHIGTINFSWITSNNNTLAKQLFEGINNNSSSIKNNSHIQIKFSTRNPADKLMGDDKEKLLIAMYPWDGTSFPGNEYWISVLAASGDPAAACCSLIASLQNPRINGENIQKSIDTIMEPFIQENSQFAHLMKSTDGHPPANGSDKDNSASSSGSDKRQSANTKFNLAALKILLSEHKAALLTLLATAGLGSGLYYYFVIYQR